MNADPRDVLLEAFRVEFLTCCQTHEQMGQDEARRCLEQFEIEHAEEADDS